LPEQRREVVVLFVRGLGVSTGRSFQGWDLEGLVLDECGPGHFLARASQPGIESTTDAIDVDLRRRRWLQFLAALVYEWFCHVLEELRRHFR